MQPTGHFGNCDARHFYREHDLYIFSLQASSYMYVNKLSVSTLKRSHILQYNMFVYLFINNVGHVKHIIL